MMTPNELIEIIRESAGEPETGSLGAGSVDVPFEDLGYDSVQVLEIAAQLKRRLGVDVSDSLVAQARTPQEMLLLVDEAVAAGGAR